MYVWIVTTVAVLSMAAFAVLFIKTGYLSKLLFKLGWREHTERANWTAFSWESCLRKLECKADVVFFGDSIIRGGDFHKEFRQWRVVNLGSSGDTLQGMIHRVSMVQALAPDKVFFLGGINGLTNRNLPVCVRRYEELMVALQKAVPTARIYVHSLLPLSEDKERQICKNETIASFNREIERIAWSKGLVFIDLHAAYVLNGKLDPAVTVDGLHLTHEAYTRWMQLLHKYLDEFSANANA